MARRPLAAVPWPRWPTYASVMESEHSYYVVGVEAGPVDAFEAGTDAGAAPRKWAGWPPPLAHAYPWSRTGPPSAPASVRAVGYVGETDSACWVLAA